MSKILQIKEAVGDKFGASVIELDGPVRTYALALARHVAMYLARKFTHLSLCEIGTSFGNRDHAGVIYAYRRIQGLLKTDKQLAHVVSLIEKDLKDLGFQECTYIGGKNENDL